MIGRPPRSTLFPYPTLSRFSGGCVGWAGRRPRSGSSQALPVEGAEERGDLGHFPLEGLADRGRPAEAARPAKGLELFRQGQRLLGAENPQRTPQAVRGMERLLIVAAPDGRREGRHAL